MFTHDFMARLLVDDHRRELHAHSPPLRDRDRAALRWYRARRGATGGPGATNRHHRSGTARS